MNKLQALINTKTQTSGQLRVLNAPYSAQYPLVDCWEDGELQQMQGESTQSSSRNRWNQTYNLMSKAAVLNCCAAHAVTVVDCLRPLGVSLSTVVTGLSSGVLPVQCLPGGCAAVL